MKNLIHLWNMRGLPSSLAALRSARATYSQFGEDAVLASLFDPGQREGLYLDLGCFRPMQWSNTYYFYRRGWRGLAVDASPRYKKEWRRFRPRDRHLTAAIVPTAEVSVREFIDSDDSPATSRCITGKAAAGRLSMNSLAIADAKDWWSFGGSPDLVSIDLEGMDHDVVLSYPFAELAPRVLVFESQLLVADHPLHQRLTTEDYALVALVGLSQIWKRT